MESKETALYYTPLLENCPFSRKSLNIWASKALANHPDASAITIEAIELPHEGLQCVQTMQRYTRQ
jgi:hypothetical protein